MMDFSKLTSMLKNEIEKSLTTLSLLKPVKSTFDILGFGLYSVICYQFSAGCWGMEVSLRDMDVMLHPAPIIDLTCGRAIFPQFYLLELNMKICTNLRERVSDNMELKREGIS
jgi:hypothetical protein